MNNTMIAKRNDAFPKNTQGPAETRLVRWTRSLLVRTVLGVIVVAVLTTGALFLSIDHLVTRQFEELHAERVERAARQIESAVATELALLAGLAELLVRDADLNNSAYYHLYLEGEVEHPRAAVERISEAFGLRSVGLWTVDGRLVSTGSGDLPAVAPVISAPVGFQSAGLYQVGDDVWLAAQGLLEHNSNPLGWLVLAEPLDDLLSILEQNHSASVRVDPAGGSQGLSAATALLELDDSSVLRLVVEIPDTVADAIREMKLLLAILLPFAALLLATALGLLLHWQLRPVSDLSASISAVGKGQFGQRLPVPAGGSELGELVRAFNNMSQGLVHLREVERKMRHQEQLSAIGQVAARVAHDINNPLSVISSANRLLERKVAADDPAREYIDLIGHHSERCIRTVESLLEYGRPLHPRLESVDPVALVRGILQRRERHDGAATRVVLDAATELPTILADPLLFERMLDNLLDNAVQAAPGGPIQVVLAAEGEDLLLEVQDSGPGFPAEARAHLFQPFFTTRKGGTGLGLASCLSIARAHGGDIEIDPGVGPGGTVRVRWPIRCTV